MPFRRRQFPSPPPPLLPTYDNSPRLLAAAKDVLSMRLPHEIVEMVLPFIEHPRSTRFGMLKSEKTISLRSLRLERNPKFAPVIQLRKVYRDKKEGLVSGIACTIEIELDSKEESPEESELFLRVWIETKEVAVCLCNERVDFSGKTVKTWWLRREDEEDASAFGDADAWIYGKHCGTNSPQLQRCNNPHP